MRKQVIQQEQQKSSPATQDWLDLEHLARVELSSEDEVHPFEAALNSQQEAGWKAAQTGAQTIRLVFDAPQKIKEIRLLFREKEQERTQEFLLRWLPAGAQDYQEIVRQQYNFSPPNTVEESEVYTPDLEGVHALELQITPDISGRSTYASLAQLQIK